VKHPLKYGLTVTYDARRKGCTRPKKINHGVIKKSTDVDGEYWYLLQNGKLCHQDKIIKIKKAG